MYIGLSASYSLILSESKCYLVNNKEGKKYVISTPMAVIISFLSGRDTLEEIQLKSEIVFKGKADIETYLQKVSEVIEDAIIFSDHPISDVGRTNLDVSSLLNVQPLFFDMLRAGRLKTPAKIVFNVINSCTYDCIYCFSKKNLHHLSEDRLVSLSCLEVFFKEAANEGCRQVVLTGGDPLLHPHILDIINMISKTDMNCILSTKSLLGKNLCKRLKGSGLSELQFSLDSLDDEINYKLTGRKNKCEDIIRTLKNIIESNVEYHIKMVLSTYNYASLDSFLSSLNTFGINKVELNLYYGEDIQSSLTADMKQDAYRIVDKFRLTGMDISIVGEKQPHICGSLVHTLFLNEDGKAYYCFRDFSIEEMYLGNIEKMSIGEIWNSPRAFALLTPSQDLFEGKCRNCQGFQKCIYYGCYYNRYIDSGSIYGEKSACNQAMIL